MATFNLGTARGKVDVDTKGLKGAASTLTSAGRGLLGVGLTASAAIGYVAKVASDFEKSMDFVAAITKASDEDMQRLIQTALDLGKKGPFGPRELADSFVELAKAGVDVDDLINGMAEASVDLAASADIGLTEATEILVNTLKTFGLESDDAIATVDRIAGAANASTIDVDDFAFSLRYAGSVATAAGIGLDDVSTALAILGDRGIKGSTAGTSLRRILLNLNPASKNAAKVMKELGIITEDGSNSFFDAQGNAKSLSEIFEILGEKTADLTQEQKIAALNDIFGARAVASGLILLDQGAKGFDEYNAAIERTTAADVAAERLDNLAGSVTLLKAAFEAVAIGEGSPFQQSLKDTVDFIRALILKFEELPPAVKEFIAKGTIAGAGLVTLAGGFLLTIGTLLRAVALAKEVALLFGAGKLLGGLAGGGAAAAGGGALAGIGAPILLIAGAIAAVGAAFYVAYKNIEPFKEFVDDVAAGTRDAFQATVDYIQTDFVSDFLGAFETVKTYFSNDFIPDVTGLFSSIGSGIGDFASEAFGDLKANGPFELFEDAALGLFDLAATPFGIPSLQEFFDPGIQDAWGGDLNFVERLFRETIPNLAGSFVDLLPDSVVNAVSNGFTTMRDAAYSLVPDPVVDFAADVFDTLRPVIDFLIEVKDTVRDFADSIAKSILDIDFGALLGFFQSIPGEVADFAESIGDFFASIPGIVSAIPGLIAGALEGIGSSIAGAFTSIQTTVTTALTNAFISVQTFLLNLGLGIATALQSALLSVVNFGIQLPLLFLQAFTGAIAQVIQFSTQMPYYIGFAIGFVLGLVARLLDELAALLFVKLPELTLEFVKWGAELALNIAKTTVEILNNIAQWVIDMGLEFASFIFNTLVSMAEFTIDLTNKFIELFADLLTKMAGWVLDMVNKAAEFAVSFLATIVDQISKMPGRFLEFTTKAFNIVRDWGPRLINKGAEIARDFLNRIVEFIKNLPVKMKEFFVATYYVIRDQGLKWLERAYEVANSVVDGIENIITSLPGVVEGILGRVIDAFKGLIRRGFNAAKDFAKGLWDGFKKGLGIGSPSNIERALFAIEDQAQLTGKNLRGSIRTLNNIGSTIPTELFDTSFGTQFGVVTPGPPSVIQVTNNLDVGQLGQGVTKQDALELSRMLAEETRKQYVAVGRRVILGQPV